METLSLIIVAVLSVLTSSGCQAKSNLESLDAEHIPTTTEVEISENDKTQQLPRLDIICDPPRKPWNGIVRYTSLKFGSELVYVCDPGFLLKHHHRRVCSEDGSWTEDDPICQEIICDFPKEPMNGRLLYSLFEYGSELVYECDNGFVLRQNHPRICLENGSWSGDDPTCQEIICSPPRNPENGNVSYTSLTYGSELVYECDNDFVLSHRHPRVCSKDGSWSGIDPDCHKIICDPPRKPENGNVLYTSLKYGSELVYECNNGFVLKHHHPRICSESGSWTEEDPVCKEIGCDPPIAPEHGYVQVLGGKTSVGSLALYICEKDRIFVGAASSRCLETGEWAYPPPKCLEQCTIPSVSHGNISKLEVVGEQKQFRMLPVGMKIENPDDLYLMCEDKYEPTGNFHLSERIVCEMSEGIEQVRCEPASCRGPPPLAENTVVKGVDWMHGGNVVYSCSRHFDKVQAENITCSFGEWVGVTAVCKDTRCHIDSVTFPGMLKVEKELYYNGQSFAVSCEFGYNQTKVNNVFRCRKGRWSGHFPPCSPASCLKEPPSISNGTIKSFKILHSSIVQYECDQHFRLNESTSRVQCYFGEWKGSPPTCEDRGCVVHRIENGEFTKKEIVERRDYYRFRRKSNNNFRKVRLNTTVDSGSSLYISCYNRRAFPTNEYTNHTEITCRKGKWEPNPVCHGNLSCHLDSLIRVIPQNVIPDVGNVNTTLLPYNYILRLKCDNNNSIRVGNGTARCGERGMWEVPRFYCRRGCTALKTDEDSHLIVHPDKNYYRLGESVILSCESGEVLSSDVVRVICLNSGWSSKEIPRCIEE